MASRDPLEGFSAGPVLDGLLDFQRDAVEHAFHRLFEAPDSTHRFLVADEVGLGKTLVAKGVLAKMLEHLRGHVERIDVVYICSNLSIARQNIERLRPSTEFKFADAERITLLPVHLHRLAESRVNFVAFTPSTSLELSSSLGTYRERVLLHALLKNHWELRGKSSLNVLQGTVRATEWFRSAATEFLARETISAELERAFHEALDRDDAARLTTNRPTLRSRFDTLCRVYKRSDARITDDAHRERNEVVGTLRGLLARSCIGALQPDLVILDEFQRFKDLLSGDTEAAELAHDLFSWQGGDQRARVLLLSATPYKAYTLQHEIEHDDHYADFIRTVEFLDNDPTRTAQLKKLLAEFQRGVFSLRDGGSQSLPALKLGIEAHLRRVMSRTERLTTTMASNGMLRPYVHDHLAVTPADLRAFASIKQLADELEVPDAMEYWKSAAYPLNFMEGYELKDSLRKRLDQGASSKLIAAIRRTIDHALDFDAIRDYREVPFLNARLRQVFDDLRGQGAFELLWLPPSLPLYQPAGRFAVASPRLTKRLVFSAWQLVPRSVATLLSYEAERLAMKADDPSAGNSPDARRARGALLRFARADDRLTGLPVMSLVYPACRLAEICDPRIYFRASGRTTPPLSEVIAWAEEQVRAELPSSICYAAEGESADESWYWRAPVLFDTVAYPDETHMWWSQPDLAAKWAPPEDRDDSDGQAEADLRWQEHVDFVRTTVRRRDWPEGRAPRDLPRMLALIGLAAPASSAYRALERLYPVDSEAGHAMPHRQAAAQIGWSARMLFNRPEATALVRRGSQDPYWKLVLEYCAAGCLPAVLEEYLHLLKGESRATAAKAATGCPEIARAVAEALTIRATTLDADDIVVEDVAADPDSGGVTLARHSMRSLFAMRFGGDRTEDREQIQRDSAVRQAFNSPFWPFVLATTSVGQEGLDFHRYCHAVVHWNLPSNPVDLEQREGRIQRYKGHAVRKNVATRHGIDALLSEHEDAWQEAFTRAARDAPVGDRGLHPCWLYPLESGACIERHILLYPLSQDEIRLASLTRSLAAYRLVFGQPRQDELLAYLLNTVSAERLRELERVLRIDLAPPPAVSAVASGGGPT